MVDGFIPCKCVAGALCQPAPNRSRRPFIRKAADDLRPDMKNEWAIWSQEDWLVAMGEATATLGLSNATIEWCQNMQPVVFLDKDEKS